MQCYSIFKRIKNDTYSRVDLDGLIFILEIPDSEVKTLINGIGKYSQKQRKSVSTHMA